MEDTDKRVPTVEQWKALDGVIEKKVGKARELTEADYNYDRDGDGVNDGVAMWLLEPGVYYSDSAVTYCSANQVGDIYDHGTFVVGDTYSGVRTILYYNGYSPFAFIISTRVSTGDQSLKNPLLVEVTQSAGADANLVMSQKAVTDAIAALGDSVDQELTDNYYTKTQIDTMVGDIESALHAINNGEES